jgi:predicted nucleic acid-binding protein
MNQPIVLDASAAVHIVLATEHAAGLAARLGTPLSVSAPDLFLSEVANSLWKYVRQGSLSSEEASTRLDEAVGLVDSIVPSQSLVHEAMVAASRHSHPVYDVMYAVLARRTGALVLTMDGGFARLLRQMEVDVYCPIEIRSQSEKNEGSG